MKNLLVTTVSTIITLSSVAITLSPQANALNSNWQTKQPFTVENTSPTNPETTRPKSSSETHLAYGYAVRCETRTNGYYTLTCCIDSYGKVNALWH